MKIKRSTKWVLLIVLVYYITTYIGLSRFGMHVANERWGIDGEGFFYVPVHDVTPDIVVHAQFFLVILFLKSFRCSSICSANPFSPVAWTSCKASSACSTAFSKFPAAA